MPGYTAWPCTHCLLHRPNNADYGLCADTQAFKLFLQHPSPTRIALLEQLYILWINDDTECCVEGC